MKTYRVHFSFYSESSGNFDESSYTVNAETLFEARRIAWTLRDKDDDARFQSCVKQTGVTWEASPLDLQDYLNALAAYNKYVIRFYRNVVMQNAEIKQDEEAKKRAESERSYYYGGLDAIAVMARDIGKSFGMIPPTAYEEIEYAWQLVNKLDEAGEHDKAAALAERIEEAKAWDNNAIHAIRDIFVKGGIYLAGDHSHFFEHFGRDGIYPEKADINEREYPYIARWDRAPHVERISSLPPFDGQHVIAGSADAMTYNFSTLVLRKGEFDVDLPENLLWTPFEDVEEISVGYDQPFLVENLVTGKQAELQRGNFHGILRPEFYENIDFEALKKEYAANNKEKVEWYDEPEDDNTDEEDWEQGDD